MRWYIYILFFFLALSGYSQPGMLLVGQQRPEQLLLDNYTGAKVAVSVRQLSGTYTGPCLRVRRASDDSEVDIGFDGGEINELELSVFCAATDCYVTKWYDQSGNGKDFFAIASNNEPLIVSSGTIEKVNGKVAIHADGTDDFFTTDGVLINNTGDNFICSVYAVGKAEGSPGTTDSYLTGLFPALTPSTDRRNIQLSLENSKLSVRLQGGNTVFSVGDSLNQVLYSISHLSTNSTFNGRRNGAALSVSSSSNQILNIQVESALNIFLSGYTTTFGDVGVPDYFDGYAQEVIWYFSNNWTSASDIETDINSYFSIY